MRLEHLRYLVHVAETGSITQSAERLFISQQGLSQAIQNLENQLGVTLFNRTGNRILLSDAGEKTVEKARTILARYEELMTELIPHRQGQTSHSDDDLIVYTTPLIIGSFLPKALSSFRRKHINTRVTLIEGKPLEVISEIRKRQRGIGLVNIPRYAMTTSMPEPPRDINFEKLCESSISAYVAKTSPLASKRILTAEQLIKYPIAVFNAEPFIELIRMLFKDVGEPYFIFKSSNVELYTETLVNSLAIGFVFSLTDAYLKNALLVSVPVENTDELTQVVGTITPSNQDLPPAAKAFIKTLKNILAAESPTRI